MESTGGEIDWVARLRDDSSDRESAIEELRSLLVRGLSKSLSTRYGTSLQIDDVAQEALLKILASLDSFEGRSRFTTWAMTIATRVGISELRRKHYKNVSLDSMTTGDDLKIEFASDDDHSAEKSVDRRNVMAKLRMLIESKLTEKQRMAVQGILDGLPVEEVARRSGSNRNAVYKLVHDARSRLREGFTEFGISAEDVYAIIA